MIDHNQKNQIRQLISSPQWGTFELLAQEMCDKIRDDPALRDTEWDTVKAVITKEGKTQGIHELIQEAYRAAEASVNPQTK